METPYHQYSVWPSSVENTIAVYHYGRLVYKGDKASTRLDEIISHVDQHHIQLTRPQVGQLWKDEGGMTVEIVKIKGDKVAYVWSNPDYFDGDNLYANSMTFNSFLATMTRAEMTRAD